LLQSLSYRKSSQVQGSSFRVAFLSLTLLVGQSRLWRDKAHSVLRCKNVLHTEESEQTQGFSPNRILPQYCAWMNPLHFEFVPSSRNYGQTWPSLSGHRPCELVPGPTAMPQYPQIVLFSCVFPSDLTNQRLRFAVNLQPLNSEPVNG